MANYLNEVSNVFSLIKEDDIVKSETLDKIKKLGLIVLSENSFDSICSGFVIF